MNYQQKCLDALSLKYRVNVPDSHWMPYVEWWLKRWHETAEDNVDRYIAKYVVWC